MMKLKIGTRRSLLARRQAERVAQRLQAAHPGLEVEFVYVQTAGDRQAGASVLELGGVGVFARELEEALLRGECDLAVHSLKDLPTRVAPGLALWAVLDREEVRDWLVTPTPVESLGDLPPGTRVGTASVRRQALLRLRAPQAQPVPVRGNVDTRLRKLGQGEVDALCLAGAGLERSGLVGAAHVLPLPPELWPHAPGQGALAVEGRSEDARTAALAAALDDPQARALAEAERFLLEALGGGCQMPVGAHAAVREAGTLFLAGAVFDPKGRSELRAQAQGRDPRGVAADVAEQLLRQGAGRWLARDRR
jgi:hydroxymethylbilane synthase